MIFSAIQLRPEYIWLLNEGAKLFTKLLLRKQNVIAITMRKIAIWMAYLKTKIRRRYCYYMTDGTVIYKVTPLWVRLLFPHGKRGSIIEFEIQLIIHWVTEYLTKITIIYLLTYELASSPRCIILDSNTFH